MVLRPGFFHTLTCAALLTLSCPAASAQEPMLQCVPYARQVSGIQLYGDAHSWWQQADGRYARGHRPVAGAVMAFKPYRTMQLGHVATVSKVVDSRRVLLNHANWSPINGRRGQVERDVLAEDVSAANDWSEVRVWYTPTGELGTTRYPIHGFIYPQGKAPKPVAAPREQIAQTDAGTPRLSRDQRKAQRLAEKEARKQRKLAEKQRKAYADYQKRLERQQRDTARSAPPSPPKPPLDPIGDILEQVGG